MRSRRAEAAAGGRGQQPARGPSRISLGFSGAFFTGLGAASFVGATSGFSLVSTLCGRSDGRFVGRNDGVRGVQGAACGVGRPPSRHARSLAWHGAMH